MRKPVDGDPFLIAGIGALALMQAIFFHDPILCAILAIFAACGIILEIILHYIKKF